MKKQVPKNRTLLMVSAAGILLLLSLLAILAANGGMGSQAGEGGNERGTSERGASETDSSGDQSNAEEEAGLTAVPADTFVLKQDGAPFIPRNPLLADGPTLYLAAADAADYFGLDLAAEEAVLALAKTDHRQQVYLPLEKTADLLEIWLGWDERTETYFTESGGQEGAEIEPGGQEGTETEPGDDIQTGEDVRMGDGIRVGAKARGRSFLFYQDGRWTADTVRGVNMGVALPGQDTGNGQIDYHTYLRWFKQISQMNANAIRIYTNHPPDFYHALADYNQQADSPLYLYQGVWVEQKEALDEAAIAKGQEDARQLVDLIHGKGEADGVSYPDDVSPWLAGWVLGSEWEPAYIHASNQGEASGYEGDYLFTLPGTPAFETGLCAIGDELLAYESETYGLQVPLAFINWPPTDIWEHPADPDFAAIDDSLNTELILPAAQYQAGLFALYHVYPTFPEFIALEGKTDGFSEYAARLYQSHTVPVAMGEYGASSSRGMSHRSLDGHYTQGGLTEEEQGQQNAALTRAVYDAGFGAAMLFAWQDEWFKGIWNTQAQTASSGLKNWYNPQNSEQSYGLLGIFPHEDKPPVYLDGDASEWSAAQQLGETPHGTLSAQHDEGYLYLLLDLTEPLSQPLYLPISIDEDSGLKTAGEQLHFTYHSQFLVEISPTGGVLAASPDYDYFAWRYGSPDSLDAAGIGNVGGLGSTFQPLYQYLRGTYTRADTGTEIPPDVHLTGALTQGVTNPTVADFSSLADYYYDGRCLEIRLPWMLLGFMDPARLLIMKPLDDSSDPSAPKRTELESLRVGFGTADGEEIPMFAYDWEPWEGAVSYHERLKAGYEIMREVFGEYKCK